MIFTPHFLKSLISFCPSLMMISTMVSAIHCACASSLARRSAFFSAFAAFRTLANLFFQRGMIRW